MQCSSVPVERSPPPTKSCSLGRAKDSHSAEVNLRHSSVLGLEVMIRMRFGREHAFLSKLKNRGNLRCFSNDISLLKQRGSVKIKKRNQEQQDDNVSRNLIAGKQKSKNIHRNQPISKKNEKEQTSKAREIQSMNFTPAMKDFKLDKAEFLTSTEQVFRKIRVFSRQIQRIEEQGEYVLQQLEKLKEVQSVESVTSDDILTINAVRDSLILEQNQLTERLQTIKVNFLTFFDYVCGTGTQNSMLLVLDYFEEKFPADKYMYSLLIFKNMVRFNDNEFAYSMYKRLLEKDIEPCNQTFKLLFRSFAMDGDFVEAREVFERIIRTQGVKAMSWGNIAVMFKISFWNNDLSSCEDVLDIIKQLDFDFPLNMVYRAMLSDTLPVSQVAFIEKLLIKGFNNELLKSINRVCIILEIAHKRSALSYLSNFWSEVLVHRLDEVSQLRSPCLDHILYLSLCCTDFENALKIRFVILRNLISSPSCRHDKVFNLLKDSLKILEANVLPQNRHDLGLEFIKLLHLSKDSASRQNLFKRLPKFVSPLLSKFLFDSLINFSFESNLEYLRFLIVDLKGLYISRNYVDDHILLLLQKHQAYLCKSNLDVVIDILLHLMPENLKDKNFKGFSPEIQLELSTKLIDLDLKKERNFTYEEMDRLFFSWFWTFSIEMLDFDRSKKIYDLLCKHNLYPMLQAKMEYLLKIQFESVDKNLLISDAVKSPHVFLRELFYLVKIVDDNELKLSIGTQILCHPRFKALTGKFVLQDVQSLLLSIKTRSISHEEVINFYAALKKFSSSTQVVLNFLSSELCDVYWKSYESSRNELKALFLEYLKTDFDLWKWEHNCPIFLAEIADALLEQDHKWNDHHLPALNNFIKSCFLAALRSEGNLEKAEKLLSLSRSISSSSSHIEFMMKELNIAKKKFQ